MVTKIGQQIEMEIRDQKQVIAEALQLCVPHLQTLKSAGWEFTLVNGKPFHVLARIEDGWLIFETTDTEPDANPWALLQMNRKLGVGTKFVMRPFTKQVRLRSEVLLCDHVDLSSRLSDLKAELTTAMGLVHQLVTGAARDRSTRVHSDAKQQKSRSGPDEFEGNEAGPSLKERCDLSGWPSVERSNGEVTVELEVPDAFHQATISRKPSGDLHLSCALPPDLKANGTTSTAGAQLLLQVSSLLRLVRAEIVEIETKGDGGELVEDSALLQRFSLTVSLPSDACANEFNEALTGLSVACDLTARETEALCDTRVADRYLQMMNGANAAT